MEVWIPGRFCLDCVTVSKLNSGVVRHSDSESRSIWAVCRGTALTTCSVPQGARAMEAISVTGFGDRGSPPGYARHRCHGRRTDRGWPEDGRGPIRGRRPQSVHARHTRSRAPRAHPTASSARSQPPPARIFERRLENFDFQPTPEIGGQSRLPLTERARTAVGPDLDLGRRSPERRHPPGCTADAGCRLRYGPADRGRLPQRVRDRRGAIPAGRDLLRPQLHAVTALDFWNAPVRATGIDPGSIYTNTNCHSASYSGSTANAVVTGRRPRVSI
jgi:hypothetical protein